MDDPTFWYRVCAGGILLSAFLLYDLACNGRAARRPKEYLFLATVTAIAMAYGIAHDFITWSIAREYYVLGKGLESAATHFSWEVVRLAMLATWSVGLVGSGILLLANNPDRHGRTLPYATLSALAIVPVVTSIAGECIGALAFGLHPGYFAAFLRDENFHATVGDRFMLVWGMHFGAYIGGGLGLAMAAAFVVIKKRQLPLGP